MAPRRSSAALRASESFEVARRLKKIFAGPKSGPVETGLTVPVATALYYLMHLLWSAI